MSMFLIVIIESLRRAGVLSEEQIKNIFDFNSLYDTLISSGVVPPISEEERNICKQVTEVLRNSKKSFSDRLTEVSRLASTVNIGYLRDIINRVVEIGGKL